MANQHAVDNAEKGYSYRDTAGRLRVSPYPPGGICIHEGCEKKRFCRGYCAAHYKRLARKGTTERQSVLARRALFEEAHAYGDGKPRPRALAYTAVLYGLDVLRSGRVDVTDEMLQGLIDSQAFPRLVAAALDFTNAPAGGVEPEDIARDDSIFLKRRAALLREARAFAKPLFRFRGNQHTGGYRD